MRVLFFLIIATALARDEPPRGDMYERAYENAKKAEARLPASYGEQPSDPKLVKSYGNPIDSRRLEQKMVRADEKAKTASTYVSELKAAEAPKAQVAAAKEYEADKKAELANAAYKVIAAESPDLNVVQAAKLANDAKQTQYGLEALRDSQVAQQAGYAAPNPNAVRINRLERRRQKAAERYERKLERMDSRIQKLQAPRSEQNAYAQAARIEQDAETAAATQYSSPVELEKAGAASYDIAAAANAETPQDRALDAAAPASNSYESAPVAADSSYGKKSSAKSSAQSKCVRQGGSCLNTLTDSCQGGSFSQYLCPGAAHIQCCKVSPAASYDVVPDAVPAASYDAPTVAADSYNAPTDAPSVEEDDVPSAYSLSNPSAGCRRICYYRRYPGAPKRRIPCAEVDVKYRGNKKCKRNGVVVDCSALRCPTN